VRPEGIGEGMDFGRVDNANQITSCDYEFEGEMRHCGKTDNPATHAKPLVAGSC